MSAGAGLIAEFGGGLMNAITQDIMWNKSNEYNTPSNQMDRMLQAGINPNAAAQGISGAPAAGSASTPQMQPFGSLGTALANSANSWINPEYAETQKAFMRAQTGKAEAETEYTKSLDENKRIENKYADKQYAAELKKAENEGIISEHQASIIAVDDYYHGAEAAAHLEQTFLTLETMSKNLEAMEAEIYETYAKAYAEMMAGNLSNAQIHKVFSDIGLNNAMIEEISHRIDNIDAATMATYQGMTESRARTWLLREQANYQKKINDEWDSTGWNRNSDVNSNIQGAIMRGDTKAAEKMLKGLQYVILGSGEARFKSKDFKMDKVVDLIGDATRLAGFGMIAGGKSVAPASTASKVPWYLGDMSHVE